MPGVVRGAVFGCARRCVCHGTGAAAWSKVRSPSRTHFAPLLLYGLFHRGIQRLRRFRRNASRSGTPPAVTIADGLARSAALAPGKAVAQQAGAGQRDRRGLRLPSRSSRAGGQHGQAVEAHREGVQDPAQLTSSHPADMKSEPVADFPALTNAL